ncbi:type II toxin-antitoxin system VapC family toxin [candidate division KSB1 bacterium]|nr:type II toxin-antitoxin system VapC family toxin [candidate division KSB1 bacterium]
MAVYFWDSNGIAKIYHPEIGTAIALQLFNTHDAVHYISRLSTLEVVSIFTKKLRMKIIGTQDFDRVYRRFGEDIRLRKWRVIKFQSSYFDRARMLLRKYGKQYSLRTLDSLQLAVCLFLRNKVTVDKVVSSDKTFNTIIKLEKFSIFDPEEIELQQKVP